MYVRTALCINKDGREKDSIMRKPRTRHKEGDNINDGHRDTTKPQGKKRNQGNGDEEKLHRGKGSAADP